MKKSGIFYAFMLLCFISFGQTRTKKADVFWGPEQKINNKALFSDIIGFDESSFYTISFRGIYRVNKRVYIDQYNTKFVSTKSAELNLSEQGKDKNFEFTMHLNDKIFIFTSFKNKKLKQNFLFVQTMNKNTLQANNDSKKIAEIDFEGKSKFNSGDFGISCSRDSSKVLIFYNMPYTLGEKEKFGFHVFDNQMNQLWEQAITLPYKDELFDVKDYVVDNDGNIHLLGLLYKDKRREKRNGVPNYEYRIISYYKEGKEVVEYPIKIAGKFLTDMKITVDNNHNIICGGFYSKEGTFSIMGSYFLTINSTTKEIMTKSFKEFGLDFITQNMTERQEKKAKKKAEKGKSVEMYEYDLDDIILRDDGGAVLIGEQFYIREVTNVYYDSKGNMHTTTNYFYYYNDIIAVNISPDGNIDWAEKIGKSQVSVNDGGRYSSYALAVVKDKMYFIFNDNPKNLFYKGSGKAQPFNGTKESLVVLVELNSKGEQTREALFTAKEAGLFARPKVCQQINSNQMILYAASRKKCRFAKVTFVD